MKNFSLPAFAILLILISSFNSLKAQVDCNLGDECIHPADTLQLITTVNPTLVSIEGCLLDANPEVIITDCNFSNNPTVWYKIIVDSLADKLDVWCETIGIENCEMAIFSGECDSLIIQNRGVPSNPQICSDEMYLSLRLNPGIKSYYLAISNANLNITNGEYELLVYTTLFKDMCEGNPVPNPAISNLVKNKINSGDQVNLGLQPSAPFLSVEAYSSLNPYIEGANYHYYDNAGNVRDTLTNLSDTIQKIKYFYRSINSTNLCYSKLDTVEIEILPKEKVIVGGKVWGGQIGTCNYSPAIHYFISDVDVSILTESGQIFASTKTDAYGAYRFIVPEGRYQVSLDKVNFQIGKGLLYLTPCGPAADPNNDVQFDNNGYWHPGRYIQTDLIDLFAGQEPGGDSNLTIDFGLSNECNGISYHPFANLNCELASNDPVCDLNVLTQNCGRMYDFSNPTGPNPICSSGSSTNTSWFSFIAGYGNYDIQFNIDDCIIGATGEIGVQAGLAGYDPNENDCWNLGGIVFCEDGLIPPPGFTIPSSDFVPGQQYVMWLDGYAASFCRYTIKINGNYSPYSVSPAVEITANGNIGPIDIITDTDVDIQVFDDDLTYMDNPNLTFRWSLRDMSGVIITDWATDPSNYESNTSILTLSYNTPGTYQICIDEIVDICGNVVSGDLCQEITVINNVSTTEIGGKVWTSSGACNFSSFDSKIFKNVSISIKDENGQNLGTTTTDFNGTYSFNVPEGRYLVVLDPINFQAGNALTNLLPCGVAQDPNNNIANDNNGYYHPGNFIQTDTIELTANNLTIDFGLSTECSSTSNNPFANLDCTTAFDNPICDLQLLVSGCSRNYDFANPGSPSPFCNGGSLVPYSISWFSFIAGYGDYDLEIQIHGCYPDSSGNAGGLVAALFNSDTENCWEENSLFCSETPTNDKITIPMSDLMIPGKKYILALDGFKGSSCGYSINLLGNYQPFIVLDPFEIICNQAERCDSIEIQNSLTFKVNDILNTFDTIKNITYYWLVKNLAGNTIDGWLTNPDLITSENQITYTFNDPGTFFMCLGEVGDVCDNIVPSDLCNEVYVNKPNYTLSGYAFIDTNLNGIFDVGELPLPNFKIIDPSSNMTYFTNEDGYYHFRVDQGLQTYEAEASYGLWDMASYAITADILVEQTVIDFPFVAVSGPVTSDAIVSSGFLRCNTFALLNVSVLNTSNRALKGSLEINFDPTTVSYEFDPQPTKITNTQYIYDFQDINPGLSFSPFIRIGIPPFFPLQDSMTFDVVIREDDGNILDRMEYSDLIRCSYDPNDKRSWPDRPGDENHILAGEIIDYTIRFQNNGNDTAFYVEVVDVISPYLDPSSITLRESSHDMKVQIHMDSVFFIFDPIALVDSTTNFEASQGFVSFSIMATEDIDAGELVQNKAEIIFDKNDPIITNSTVNTVVDILPCYHISNDINQDGNILIADEQGISYQWIDCEDGTIVYESTEFMFTPELNGLYQIIIDGDNCQNVTDCYSFTLSGTKDQDEYKLILTPNPTTGLVRIHSKNTPTLIKVFTSQGKLVESLYDKKQFDMKEYSAGLYIVKIAINNQIIERKLIKN